MHLTLETHGYGMDSHSHRNEKLADSRPNWKRCLFVCLFNSRRRYLASHSGKRYTQFNKAIPSDFVCVLDANQSYWNRVVNTSDTHAHMRCLIWKWIRLKWSEHEILALTRNAVFVFHRSYHFSKGTRLERDYMNNTLKVYLSISLAMPISSNSNNFATMQTTYRMVLFVQDSLNLNSL